MRANQMSNQSKARMKSSIPMRPFSERTDLAQSKCACGASPGIASECDECRARRLAPQRHPIDPPVADTVLSRAAQPLTQPLTQRAGSTEAGSDSAAKPPEREAARPETAKAPSFIVEDDVKELGPEQMRKGEFLDQMEREVCS